MLALNYQRKRHEGKLCKCTASCICCHVDIHQGRQRRAMLYRGIEAGILQGITTEAAAVTRLMLTKEWEGGSPRLGGPQPHQGRDHVPACLLGKRHRAGKQCARTRRSCSCGVHIKDNSAEVVAVAVHRASLFRESHPKL